MATDLKLTLVVALVKEVPSFIVVPRIIPDSEEEIKTAKVYFANKLEDLKVSKNGFLLLNSTNILYPRQAHFFKDRRSLFIEFIASSIGIWDNKAMEGSDYKLAELLKLATFKKVTDFAEELTDLFSKFAPIDIERIATNANGSVDSYPIVELVTNNPDDFGAITVS